MAFRLFPIWAAGIRKSPHLNRAGRAGWPGPLLRTGDFIRPASNGKLQNVAAFPLPGLLAASLKALVHGFGFFGRHRDFLVLLAQFLVHECDRVISRRQAFDFIFSALVGDGIERVLHYIDVHLHPGVLIALDRQHDFFAGEVLFDRSGRWWLRFVPLAIIFRCGMDVVRGLIVILNLHGLSRHYAPPVRMILAAALVEDDFVLGYVEGTAAESVFYIDEDVGEIAARYDHSLGFVHAFASRILAHVDLCLLRRGAIKLPGAIRSVERLVRPEW